MVVHHLVKFVANTSSASEDIMYSDFHMTSQDQVIPGSSEKFSYHRYCVK